MAIYIDNPALNAGEWEAASQYREAAARLVEVMKHVHDPVRLSVLKRVARDGSEMSYPRFLKLLLIVAESDDTLGKQALADCLAAALRSMDLPAGELTAWGASQLWQTGFSRDSFMAKTMAAAPTRNFGPVEYLAVWFCQKTQRPYLSVSTYQTVMSRLLELINHNAEARELYPRKILADLALASEGAFTRSTRQHLKTLADAWLQALPPETVAQLAAGQQSLAPSGA